MNKERILEALREVYDPEVGKSIVELQMVKDVQVENGNVRVEILLTVKGCPLTQTIERDIKEAIYRLDGVKNVEVHMETMNPEQLQQFVEKIKKRHPLAGLAQVDWVIAIASGKGGVGKSSVAVQLAFALQKNGKVVGVFDADVWGPSIAKMLKLEEVPEAVAPGLIEPPEVNGMKVISFGSILKEKQPVIWRGPMVHKAIEQLLLETLWGKLDYLLIDLPPGTGDVAISVCQLGRIDGVILVTTPQDISLLDVWKAAAMFRSMGVPLLGLVENMSYFTCEVCGTRHEIFGSGGAEKLSEEENISILARIPLDPKLREAGDAGVNFVREQPQREAAQAFMALAENVMKRLSPCKE
ncbi:MAG: Mrp/NBP35 family ATP-binding protein [bacterium JZ-2024 1]